MINYTEARSEFNDLVSKNQGVQSAYEAGSVSTPGLSDLDFILILHDKWDVSDTQLYYATLNKMSPNLRAAIGPGNILLIPKSLESEMLMIDDFNLKSISTPKLNIKLNTYKDKYSEICRILDWLPERVNTLGSFLSHRYYTLDENCKYFQLHGLLKSLLLSIKKVSLIVECERSRNIYYQNNKRIIALRNTWFNLKEKEREEKIQDTTNAVFSDALEVLDIFCCFMVKKIDGSINFQPSIGCQTKKFRAFNLCQSAQWSLFSKHNFRYEFHNIVFLNYYLQSKLKNQISNKIKNSINYGDQIKENDINSFTKKFCQTIERRLNYVNANYEFLKKSELRTGLLKYGMYLEDD